MPINVEHQPSPTTIGAMAYETGIGARRERDLERARQMALERAKLGLQAQGMGMDYYLDLMQQANQNRRFAAGLEAQQQQAQQQRQWELQDQRAAAQMRQQEWQHELMADQLGRQQYFDQRMRLQEQEQRAAEEAQYREMVSQAVQSGQAYYDAAAKNRLNQLRAERSNIIAGDAGHQLSEEQRRQAIQTIDDQVENILLHPTWRDPDEMPPTVDEQLRERMIFRGGTFFTVDENGMPQVVRNAPDLWDQKIKVADSLGSLAKEKQSRRKELMQEQIVTPGEDGETVQPRYNNAEIDQIIAQEFGPQEERLKAIASEIDQAIAEYEQEFGGQQQQQQQPPQQAPPAPPQQPPAPPPPQEPPPQEPPPKPRTPGRFGESGFGRVPDERYEEARNIVKSGFPDPETLKTHTSMEGAWMAYEDALRDWWSDQVRRHPNRANYPEERTLDEQERFTDAYAEAIAWENIWEEAEREVRRIESMMNERGLKFDDLPRDQQSYLTFMLNRTKTAERYYRQAFKREREMRDIFKKRGHLGEG